MLTKNGKKCIKNIIRQNAYRVFGSPTEETTITVKRENGNDVSITNMWGQYSFPQTESLSLFNAGTGGPWSGLYFGSGSNAPTENDYTITPITTSSQSVTKISAVSYMDEHDNVCFDLVYMYINGDATNTVTINEYGLFSGMTNSTSTGVVLVYRDVFDEPIVIAPGERKFIKITMKMGW